MGGKNNPPPSVISIVHQHNGLIAMDPLTQERTPRRSSSLYREICGANAITEDIVERYAPQAMDCIFT